MRFWPHSTHVAKDPKQVRRATTATIREYIGGRMPGLYAPGKLTCVICGGQFEPWDNIVYRGPEPVREVE